MEKKKAITVAQVIGILVIGGILFAILNPSKNNKDYSAELYKTYKELQQAVAQIPELVGCYSGDFYCAIIDKSTESVDGQIFNELKARKTYLISKGFDISEIDIEGTGSKCTTVFGNNSRIKTHPCFTTTDGRMISGTTVDINGEKGPNKTCEDQFYFTTADKTRNGINNGDVLDFGSKEYATFFESVSDYNKNWRNCNGDPECEAMTCTGRIIEQYEEQLNK